ncbi:hypothetical protein O6H91_01G139000 [Diphasiastrum complanatum]|uniref:Uncharacterized protein n=3 Tax=Diphasiastrum complanatum TaxID=34168 RepID=A0ACC2EWY8_DIPCM|nr:hypothetical protein O6H91_01G138300 [Diphasiastrum complanatum]KAJ7570895.1 hypothetical protein O6H91_01G138500 [Diphasiastrum complanatum]KAJ7570902.1 hypothetical protein O6H91_01G139000 [Diphasiastrum complanatum]
MANTSSFGFRSTGEEVTNGVHATGLTAIVTGGTSGIGAETVRVLALRGAHVYLLARNLKAADTVKAGIVKSIPNARIDLLECDLSSLASVRKCSEQFLALNQPLNILVNNAGIMGCPFTLTQDGIEMQFATNHLGHFLLTDLLLEKLKHTAHESGVEGRIVNVSSVSHTWFNPKGDFALDKINDKANYSPLRAYGQSKLANILHANELARRFKEEHVNLTANSLHPGGIHTNVLRHFRFAAFLAGIADYARNLTRLKSISQGAATQCYLVLNPKAKGINGKYFVDCKESIPNKHACDPDLAKSLWELSVNLISKN